MEHSIALCWVGSGRGAPCCIALCQIVVWRMMYEQSYFQSGGSLGHHGHLTAFSSPPSPLSAGWCPMGRDVWQGCHVGDKGVYLPIGKVGGSVDGFWGSFKYSPQALLGAGWHPDLQVGEGRLGTKRHPGGGRYRRREPPKSLLPSQLGQSCSPAPQPGGAHAGELLPLESLRGRQQTQHSTAR